MRHWQPYKGIGGNWLHSKLQPEAACLAHHGVRRATRGSRGVPQVLSSREDDHVGPQGIRDHNKTQQPCGRVHGKRKRSQSPPAAHASSPFTAAAALWADPAQVQARQAAVTSQGRTQARPRTLLTPGAVSLGGSLRPPASQLPVSLSRTIERARNAFPCLFYFF